MEKVIETVRIQDDPYMILTMFKQRKTSVKHCVNEMECTDTRILRAGGYTHT